jgi:hypothetical protein
MSVRIRRVQDHERSVAGLGLVAVGALVVVLLAACSGTERPTLTAPPTTVPGLADPSPLTNPEATVAPLVTDTRATDAVDAGDAADPAPAADASDPGVDTAGGPSGGPAGGDGTADPRAATVAMTEVTVPSIPLPDLLLGDEVAATVPGATPVPAGEPGSGALDVVAAAAAEQDQQAELALLETRRFVRGEQRTWLSDDPGGPRVYASVYEFAEPSGARAYLVDGREHLEARGAGTWSVATVGGATGFTQTDPAGSFVAHGVVFTRDRWFFLVVGGGTDVDTVSALAAAQEQRFLTLSA